MNEFALNGAAIDGEANELVMLEGTAAIDLAVAFDGIRGVSLLTSSEIRVNLSGALYGGIEGSGFVDIELDAAMAPSLLTMITGEIPITLQDDMFGSAGIMGDGNVDIALDAAFNLTRRAMADGEISIAFGLTGDGRIVQRVKIDGACGIVLDPLYLRGRRTPAIRPDMPLDVAMKVTGPAALEMRGEGASDIDLVLDGITRLGGKVNIEGSTAVELNLRGFPRQYTLVPIEGIADIEFLLVSERAGRPTIPTEYMPAPAGRCLVVARQPRERRVVCDRTF